MGPAHVSRVDRWEPGKMLRGNDHEIGGKPAECGSRKPSE